MPIIVHKVSLGNAKTPATLKAIDDTTEPDRAPQEPGNAEEIDESYCLVWSAGLPLTGVGVGGGAGDLMEFDGLDDRLCDRVRVYP
jgi:hypothetical protein